MDSSLRLAAPLAAAAAAMAAKLRSAAGLDAPLVGGGKGRGGIPPPDII